MKTMDQKIIRIFIDQIWAHTIECDHKVSINETEHNEWETKEKIRNDFFPKVIRGGQRQCAGINLYPVNNEADCDNNLNKSTGNQKNNKYLSSILSTIFLQ
jgi:hypothetical protein